MDNSLRLLAQLKTTVEAVIEWRKKSLAQNEQIWRDLYWQNARDCENQALGIFTAIQIITVQSGVLYDDAKNIMRPMFGITVLEA